MRQLTLTNDQFDALFEYMREVVETLEDYMITKKDDNGNEVLEDISKYEAYQIYQQLVSLKNDAKLTIIPQQLASPNNSPTTLNVYHHMLRSYTSLIVIFIFIIKFVALAAAVAVPVAVAVAVGCRCCCCCCHWTGCGQGWALGPSSLLFPVGWAGPSVLPP